MFKQLANLLFNTYKKTQNSRQIRLHTQGDYFCLRSIYREINEIYFENALDVKITWFGNRDYKPRTRATFGSYCDDKKLIRIHRRLDQEHIPYYFISYIVYHEMLHHVYPPIVNRQRKREIHHSLFLEKEKQFLEYHEANQYFKKMRSSWFAS
ncbi:MAG: hypothetical protein Tsb0021_00860 [Chlamydiales bacterium]